MPLDFSRRRPRPATSRAVLWRLGSLLMGLVLVASLMLSIRTPQTQARLAAMFGEATGTESTEQLVDRTKAAAELLAKVDRELLETLDDDTPFRNSETAAWFHLLSLARDTPPEQLGNASAGQITYAQLLQQPDHYRGRVVTVVGLAHRVERVQPSTNDEGIDTLFRVIIQPAGTGRLPFTCYCLELPQGYTVSGEPRPVRFAGLFLKNWVYPHQQGLDKSPVLVGRTLVPLDANTGETVPAQPPSVGWLVATGVAVVVGVSLLLRQAMLKPRPLTGIGSARHDDDSTAIAAQLRELEAPSDVEEGETTP